MIFKNVLIYEKKKIAKMIRTRGQLRLTLRTRQMGLFSHPFHDRHHVSVNLILCHAHILVYTGHFIFRWNC